MDLGEILRRPIVGILRGISMEIACEVARTYVGAGLDTLEVTMNTEDAADIINILGKEFPDLNVGAGTVCNMKDLENALNAGAQFIVTPIMDEEVIRTAVAHNITIFPGAYRAWSLGASAVKIFPATQLGPRFIKDVMAPLNGIKLLPTGGIAKENIRSFFEAGAAGVGMGSSLFDDRLIKNKNFDGLRNHFLEIKNEINEYLI